MLDKRTVKLLSVLVKLCDDGSYKIIEINDLVKAMLPRFRVDAKELGQMMRFLIDNEMINTKYSDERVFCVAVLPKGRVADEESRIGRKNNRNLSRAMIIVLVFGCLSAAFLGALAGAIFVKYLF
jgi:hypothetical protein